MFVSLTHNCENRIKEIGSAVALGSFDGVHIGHLKLMKALLSEENTAKIVHNFTTRPENLLGSKNAVLSITTNEQKIGIFKNLGLDGIVFDEFNNDFMKMSAEDFVLKVLIKRLNAKTVVVGEDYFFGYKKSGNAELLMQYGEKLGFKVVVIEKLKLLGKPVSSSLIREYIEAGEMEMAASMLSRPFCIEGTVVCGNRLGKSLGVPTANINLPEGIICPQRGVYFTDVIVGDVSYKGVTNVGVKPTIGSFQKNIETHILNFNRDIYGQEIKIMFLKKHRDEIKFKNVDELAKKLNSDLKKRKEFDKNL